MDVANKKRCLKMISTFAAQADKSLIFVTHYKEEIPDSVNHIFELAAH
jgi:molybdate transport system ATP-binding protein